jgi:large subunit ribosomal protein L23
LFLKPSRYPLYQRGNPQLRVFLPNFFMKMIKPPNEQPPNTVTFVVSTEMTRHDIKNYLEKIYKIPVINVRTQVTPGETTRDPVKGYVKKDPDYKTAFVELVKKCKY